MQILRLPTIMQLNRHGRFANFQCAPGRFSSRSFQNRGGLLANLRNARQDRSHPPATNLPDASSHDAPALGLFPGNAGNRRQRFHRFGDLLLKPFGRPCFGFDIHLPTSQFRSQPRVLTALADRQRKLILADDDLHALAWLHRFQSSSTWPAPGRW